MLRDYELMMVLSPELDDAAVAQAVERVKGFVGQRGGTVGQEEIWGRRKLAYSIRKFTEGNYVLTRFNLDPQHANGLEANLRVSEEVLRHLLVKKER